MLRMIIANRLRDGLVVFLDEDLDWVTSIDDGALIEDELDAARLLEISKEHERACLVVDPNLIEVLVDDAGRRPAAIREAIRAFGPSVRTDLADLRPGTKDQQEE